MKTILLKLEDSIIVVTESILPKIEVSRNKYVNQALDHYNKIQLKKIKAESALVRKE